MYCDGFLENIFNIPDGNTCCFLSSSIRSLLADTKAISIPEKKADNRRVVIMIKNNVIYSISNSSILVLPY
jgi:hypothetical protein